MEIIQIIVRILVGLNLYASDIQDRLLKTTETEDIRPEAKELKKYVVKYCIGCHVDIGAGTEKNVLSKTGDFLKAGVLQRFINRSEPTSSQLYQQVLTGAMPIYVGKSFTPNEKAQFLQVTQTWIEAGAPELEQIQILKARSKEEVIQIIENDLRQSTDPQNTRYISLLNLFNNSETQSSVVKTVEGVSKILNSLSWRSRLVKPVSLSGQLYFLLRIKLSDYGWDAQTWNKIEKLYPYSLDYTNVEINGRRPLNDIQKYTRTRIPIIRGDWMVAQLSKPPLYHEILVIPNSDLELESMLSIDVAQNIRRKQAPRAGFTDSGVSVNNRVIERHPTKFGGYWKSYDFAGGPKDPQKNIKVNPLGPLGIFANGFKHDGGEIIFNLPNGLQGYMLINGSGQRIDVAPTAVVTDPGQLPDRAVVNGISCMRCHDSGMKAKSDQIQDLFSEKTVRDKFSERFFERDLSTIDNLYSKGLINQYLNQDMNRFKLAQHRLGISNGEPISSVTNLYDRTLNFKSLVAELRLTKNDVERINKDPQLTGIKAILKESSLGGIKRDIFEAQFNEIHRKLNEGSVDYRASVSQNDSASPYELYRKAVASYRKYDNRQNPGLDKMPSLVREQFNLAVSKGSPDAAAFLASELPQWQSNKESLRLLKFASDRGNRWASFQLGTIIFDEGDPESEAPKQALEYFNLALKQKIPEPDFGAIPIDDELIIEKIGRLKKLLRLKK